MTSTVYLLHFSAPHQHAQHYIGYTTTDLAERLERHRSGNDANLVRVAIAAGIRVSLAHAWYGAPRKFELTLKAKGSAKPLCPPCNMFAYRRARLDHDPMVPTASAWREQKKGPPRKERPKSREETPKEGNGIATA